MSQNTYYCMISCIPKMEESSDGLPPRKLFEMARCGREHDCPEASFLSLPRELTPKEFEKLTREYKLSPCPYSGFSRYIASHPLRNHHINGFGVIGPESLTIKPGSIDTLFQQE